MSIVDAVAAAGAATRVDFLALVGTVFRGFSTRSVGFGFAFGAPLGSGVLGVVRAAEGGRDSTVAEGGLCVEVTAPPVG